MIRHMYILIIIICVIILILYYLLKPFLNNYSSITETEIKNHSQTNNPVKESSQSDINNNETVPTKKTENYSDFQMELKKCVRTPAQVKNEEDKKIIENIKKHLPAQYHLMKRELLKKANSGEYTTINGQKFITIDYDLGTFGALANSLEIKFTSLDVLTWNIKYTIKNHNVYNTYIEELNMLTAADNIKYKIMLVNKYSSNKKEYYDIPCNINTKQCDKKYTYIVRCSITF